MEENLEGLIRLAYRGWKRRHPDNSHLDEEDLAAFIEGKLSIERADEVRQHIIHCQECSEVLGLSLVAELAMENEPSFALVDSVKDKLGIKVLPALEIFLKLKDKAFELVKASGDILMGQELIPAGVLRSRNIGGFRDEVVILKDFENIRVRVRVENKTNEYFNINIEVKDKQSKTVIRDLRVTLFKEGVELESYLNDAGSVTFEHVILGKYRIDISDLDKNLAAVFIEVRA